MSILPTFLSMFDSWSICSLHLLGPPRPSSLVDSITPSVHCTYSISTCAMANISLLQRGFDPIVDLCKKHPLKFVCDASERYHQSSWAQSSIVVTVPSPSKDSFVQVTDDETTVQKTFFIPPQKYGRAPFCILSVDAVWPLFIKRPSRNLRCVF